MEDVLTGEYYEIRYKMFKTLFRSRDLAEAVAYANKVNHRLVSDGKDFGGSLVLNLLHCDYSPTGSVFREVLVGAV